MGEASVTAQDVRELLAVRYSRPEWVLAHEVTLGRRRLDTLAVRLWGGSGIGYQVLGFEIKVSRADWLRELKSIDKAHEWATVVDQFFVVAPKAVVALDELPRDWGLIEVANTGVSLRIRAHPAKRASGETLPRELVARLLDRDSRSGDDPQVRVERDLACRAAAAVEREKLAREIERARQTEATMAALLEEAGEKGALGLPDLIRRSRRLDDAMSKMPSTWELDRAASAVKEVADRAAMVVGDLSVALVEFRMLAEARRG